MYHLQHKYHKWSCLSHRAALQLVDGANPRAGSLGLLRSGQDSDCRLRCGGVEWKTHVSFLVSCPKMRAQLTDENRVVTITGLTSWEMQICLEYLYQHGKIDLTAANALTPRKQLPVTIVHLHAIATLMDLPGLADFARGAYVDWDTLVLGLTIHRADRRRLVSRALAADVDHAVRAAWARGADDPCRFPWDMVSLVGRLSRLLAPFDLAGRLREEVPGFAKEYDDNLRFVKVVQLEE